eukprot:CAMPEP_0178636724 /NCGR_PEP_ID=MMETSP0698-20121128/13911_1 /TAXON_ID=265572 /ORGANISM="Extubocellulus spinifer, Strain CCMP396" /LENGTH=508 /DNA_ID=CAMNT_0020276667 /DNA_START=331 /DNA_END=1857 /DNA_ORIENTATION=-
MSASEGEDDYANDYEDDFGSDDEESGDGTDRSSVSKDDHGYNSAVESAACGSTTTSTSSSREEEAEEGDCHITTGIDERRQHEESSPCGSTTTSTSSSREEEAEEGDCHNTTGIDERRQEKESPPSFDWPLTDFVSVPPPAAEEVSKQSSPPAHSSPKASQPNILIDTVSPPAVQEDKEAPSLPVKQDEEKKELQPAPNSLSLSTTPDNEATLRQKFVATSSKLVKEAEKNVSLGLRFEKQSEELSRIRAEVKVFRTQLLQGINGGSANVEDYKNVPLSELLRLLKQEPHSENGPLPSSKRTSRTASSSSSPVVDGTPKQLERHLIAEKKRSRLLEKRVAELQTKLDDTGTGAGGGDIDLLKAKVLKLGEKCRIERELKARSARELTVSLEKTQALSDHIEKLMLHLKQEANAKVKALKQLSLSNREVELLQSRTVAMTKRNGRKDQVIADLKEEALMLERELRKMEDKYNELRLKVDWTRTQTTLGLKKKTEEIHRLQGKLAWTKHK